MRVRGDARARRRRSHRTLGRRRGRGRGGWRSERTRGRETDGFGFGVWRPRVRVAHRVVVRVPRAVRRRRRRWFEVVALAVGWLFEARGWIGTASRLRRSVAVAVPGATHAPSHNVVAGASRASSSAAGAARRWLPILRGSVRWMSRLVA